MVSFSISGFDLIIWAFMVWVIFGDPAELRFVITESADVIAEACLAPTEPELN